MSYSVAVRALCSFTAKQGDLDRRLTPAPTAQEGIFGPYYLSQEMVRWADVVVGDYNYYFGGGGLLFGLTLENDWQVGVLVDEAHNLIERARLMHTAARWLRSCPRVVHVEFR